ncbi:MAG TPA: T9SS type A sorting domain-containing protein, partial [Ignavibacteriaceae bacterium]|nr:T9SS type A sorting domain-containing protein [Ignavibacteriaceae bacterium]
ESGSSGSVLYVSDDAGTNWFQMADTSGFDIDWLNGQGWYDNTIAVDPYNKNRVYVGGINLWRLDRVAGSDTSEKQITNVDEVNTASFLSFVNWGGGYAHGGLDRGEVFHGLPTGLDESEYSTVEIRFGPGMTQKAHRFIFSANFLYPYVDYVDVPFEVWDTDHNRQLMVSFRDQDGDGTWNPMDRASAPGGISREYVFIHAVPYDPSNPDSNIAVTAGMAYKNTYAFWPEAPGGTVFDPNNLPSSLIRINWGEFITYRLSANVITDGYQEFGGSPKGVHVDQHNIQLVPTNLETQSFRLVNGNDGGVSFSDDKGATFLQPKNGYNTTQFYGVDKMNGADRYIGGTQDNGSFLSPENPNNLSAWESAPSGDGFEAVWHYNNPDLILESSQYNSILKTTDRGATWNSAGSTNGLTDQGSTGSPFITKLAKSKQDPDLVFAVGLSGVWRSDDFADSWTLTKMPAEFIGDDSFSDVKISLINPQIVWAGDGMSNTNRIYVSLDGGLSFDTTVNYTAVTLGRLSSLETDPIDERTAYTLFSFAKTAKILKTTDLGQTWADISGFGTDTVSSAGFPDVAVYCLLVMPFNTNIIWAGTEIGIFQTTNGGSNWALLGQGFPPVAVHELVIVNDEVVAATHGRGIWSTSLAELTNYVPSAPAALSPRLSPIAQNPSGVLVIPFALRSAYDSAHVIINNEIFEKISATSSAVDTIIYFPVTQKRTDSVQIIGYKNGRAYKSYQRTSEDKVLSQPVHSYSNNFNNETQDFVGDFVITTEEGFDNDAIHSDHPYSNNTTSIYQLLIPIIVGQNGSSISYRDIALVEPGDPGSVFGDENFYDYVVVEGTKDGINWKPLADGYDCRKDNIWLSIFLADSVGDSTMFRPEAINILNTFSAGDTILIRFKLFADGASNGWGWAIDDLVIQETTVGVAGRPKIPTSYSLSQNYPNPFNPTTIIKYQLPQQQKVTLEIFNALGQKVKTLVDGIKNAGYYQETWNGTNDNNLNVATGVYIYRLSAGNFVVSKKMILLK